VTSRIQKSEKHGLVTVLSSVVPRNYLLYDRLPALLLIRPGLVPTSVSSSVLTRASSLLNGWGLRDVAMVLACTESRLVMTWKDVRNASCVTPLYW
jgi:hypothetical protein